MTKFNKLIKRAYQAAVDRELITDKTTKYNFCFKIRQETIEAEKEIFSNGPEEKYVEEITDIATVCISALTHLGYDFVKEFEKVVEKNERRAKK